MSTTPEIPPASFATLVSMLATQAMVALGQIADPQSGQPVKRLPLAQHFIDSLSVLEEKTRGNLTPVESGMLTNILYELRMCFVAAQKQP